MHWACAASICAGFAVAETLLAARKPAEALRSLRQPRWSPPLWLWAVIGATWYLICFLALARILPRLNDAPLPASLLLALMAANALRGAVQTQPTSWTAAMIATADYGRRGTA
jgi:tryptophan-rich sensory protein